MRIKAEDEQEFTPKVNMQNLLMYEIRCGNCNNWLCADTNFPTAPSNVYCDRCGAKIKKLTAYELMKIAEGEQ